jgi:hypothetical protein
MKQKLEEQQAQKQKTKGRRNREKWWRKEEQPPSAAQCHSATARSAAPLLSSSFLFFFDSMTSTVLQNEQWRVSSLFCLMFFGLDNTGPDQNGRAGFDLVQRKLLVPHINFMSF